MARQAKKDMEVQNTRFPEKLKEARQMAKLNQTDFATAIGVTQRSVTDYERGAAIPRTSTIRRMARVLNVTYEYLTNDDCDNPQEGAQREAIIENARSQFGPRHANQLNKMLDETIASFAGGDIPTEDMDAFTDAFMTAIAMGKEKARKKFTPKTVQEKWSE